QCRSRRNFYTHKAFERITSLRILFEQILDEGRRAGVFRKDIHNSALWHIIFGLTDVECLMSYRFEGTRQAHGDLDGIMDVILPMITLGDGKGDRKQDKTGKILKAAERVFAEKGFEHAKIQEIAKRAGVADGSIYDYFSSKDELLFSIIQDGFLESPFKKGFKAYLPPQKPAGEMDSPVEKMKRFIRQLLFLTLIQPDFAKILVLHGIYNQQFYGSAAFECFLDYLKTIDVILEEGKTAGLFRKTAVNRIFRNLVLGMFSTNALRWFLQDDGHKRDKVKEIDTLVTYMIRSIIRPEKIDLV
ncbi:MAG: TetR/AcrR family transcriptional regulator, partial [bacterium]